MLIYEFHYKYIKKNYSTNFLFTDTDSLVYEIKTEDVYGNCYQDENLFHLRDYPHSNFFNPVNKKVNG